jgi:branched-chain amino acid transport system substrate-binding protein
MANCKQSFLVSAGLAAVAFSVGCASPIQAQPAEVKVGLIAPMSGPWARQGDLMLKGAQLAIEDINQAGGIDAMAGAKMKLVVFDAGDTVEKAKNAASGWSRKSRIWSGPAARGCRASRSVLRK